MPLAMGTPVLQPMTAADPNLDVGDWLQSIPVEIRRRVLPFCDIPSLVLFAATSASYRRFVFEDCTFLWTTIDFGNVNQSQAARLTDECLNSLLSNANARRATTSLSLMGCTSVQGTGLAPLMFSRHLEQIELRKSQQEIETCGGTGLNDAFVVAVLSSMAPMNESLAPRHGSSSGLKSVKIRKQHESPTFFEAFAEPIRGFMTDWIEAISNQVKEQRVVCKECNGALVDRIPEEDFAWKLATCFCAKCKSYFCGEKGCEISLGCMICMEQFCGNCMYVASCDLCTKLFCDHCRLVGWCDSEQCEDQSYCVECRDTAFCDQCEKWWCTQCRNVPAVCDSCGKAICEECGTFKSCEECGCDRCAECDPVEYCRSCAHCHCRDCGDSQCCFQSKKRMKISGSDENGNEPPWKR
jgi:hypothetical protein